MQLLRLLACAGCAHCKGLFKLSSQLDFGCLFALKLRFQVHCSFLALFELTLFFLDQSVEFLNLNFMLCLFGNQSALLSLPRFLQILFGLFQIGFDFFDGLLLFKGSGAHAVILGCQLLALEPELLSIQVDFLRLVIHRRKLNCKFFLFSEDLLELPLILVIQFRFFGY